MQKDWEGVKGNIFRPGEKMRTRRRAKSRPAFMNKKGGRSGTVNRCLGENVVGGR